MLTPQLSPEDRTLLIPPLYWNSLGTGCSIKLQFSVVHRLRGTRCGEQGALCQSTRFACSLQLRKSCRTCSGEAGAFTLTWTPGDRAPRLENRLWVSRSMSGPWRHSGAAEIECQKANSKGKPNSRPWTENRVCGGCRRTKPGLILLVKTPKDVYIQRGGVWGPI